jgi:AraC-like DNA-binding protein
MIRTEFHSLVVHLGGNLQLFESEVRSGPAKVGSPVSGEIWIVPAHSVYSARVAGGAVHYGEVRFAPDAFRQLIGGEGPIEEVEPHLGIRDGFIHQAVRQLVETSSRLDDMAVLYKQSLIMGLCYRFFTSYGLGAEDRLARARGLNAVARARIEAFIEANLAERITLTRLSDVASMSPKVFIRAFTVSFGETPVQYIISQRTRRARLLLADPTLDISSIAHACGFAHHPHLSRVFKRRVGMTPSQYRDDVCG